MLDSLGRLEFDLLLQKPAQRRSVQPTKVVKVLSQCEQAVAGIETGG